MVEFLDQRISKKLKTQHEPASPLTNYAALLNYDVWTVVFKYLWPSHLLKIRALSKKHQSFVIDKIYSKFHLILFRNAGFANDLSSLINIYNYYAKDKEIQQNIIKLAGAYVVGQAAYNFTNKTIEILEKIHEWAVSHGILSYILKLNACGYFKNASARGNLELLKLFYGWGTKREQNKMIQLGPYRGFRSALMNGHFEAAQYIFELSNDNHKRKMMLAKSSRHIVLALTNGGEWWLQILNWLDGVGVLDGFIVQNYRELYKDVYIDGSMDKLMKIYELSSPSARSLLFSDHFAVFRDALHLSVCRNVTRPEILDQHCLWIQSHGTLFDIKMLKVHARQDIRYYLSTSHPERQEEMSRKLEHYLNSL